MKSLFRRDEPSQEAIELRQETAEFELFVVQAELESRDNLGHGLKHLGYLLSFDPGRPEWLALVDAYEDAVAGDLEALLPTTGERHYAQEALRALLWRRAGRLADAVQLLFQVARAVPESKYVLEWVPEWLGPEGVLESLEGESVAGLLAMLVVSVPESRHQSARTARRVRRFSHLAERTLQAFDLPDHYSMLLAGLFRKAGDGERALEFLEQRLASGGGRELVLGQGLALRSLERVEEAEQAFERAVALDPRELSAYLEAGDMFLDRRRWREAEAWYERGLAVEPENVWALPSAIFARWQMTRQERDGAEGEPPMDSRLRELAEQGNARASLLFGEFRPFEGYLPEPQDASANVLRQILDQVGSGGEPMSGEVRLTVNLVEPPSVHRAVEAQLRKLSGGDLSLVVTCTGVPSPDPRRPAVDDLGYVLWSYDGFKARPASAPVDPRVAAQVAELASRPFDPLRNRSDAGRVAAGLGPEQARDLLAVACDPPPIPDGVTSLVWWPRVQLAAAQVLSQLEEGWQGSERRRALRSMLLGPRDWITEAAILALAELVDDEPALALDVHEMFLQLEKAEPDQGHWSYIGTLYGCWPRLPILFQSEREELHAKLDAYWAADEAEHGTVH